MSQQQEVVRFRDHRAEDPYVDTQIRDYLGENQDMRVVAMVGGVTDLIVVFEPKPEVAS